jgi:hypothetical protein
MEKYINYETVKFDITEIKGYRLLADMQTGSFYWGKPESSVTIWATPEWDECKGKCPIQLDGYYNIGNSDLSDGHMYDLGTPYDLEAQKEKYLAVITAIIEGLEKPYKDLNDLLDNVLINF